ncbi:MULTISPECIES: hypothetical protein [unclassified Ruegeria]|nr:MULTISPECIES: hypothetical protein [unclassified Ruegeria]
MKKYTPGDRSEGFALNIRQYLKKTIELQAYPISLKVAAWLISLPAAFG